MLKNFVKKVGGFNLLIILLTLSIIVVAEYIFLQGHKLDAIFLGLWAPTLLGFMNYFKHYK